MQETRYCVKTLEMPLRRYKPPADLDKSFAKLEANIRNFSKRVDAMHTRLDKLEAAGTINRVRHLAPPAGVRVIVDGDEIYAAEDQVLAVEQGHRALSKPAGVRVVIDAEGITASEW